MREEFKNDNERVKKHLNELLEKEILSNKEKVSESKKIFENLNFEMNKYKNLYAKANKKLFELGTDLEDSSPKKMKKNPEIGKTIDSKIQFTDLKTSERLNEWSKLERELEDNKNSLKNIFSHKLSANKFNPMQSELYDSFMLKKLQEVNEQKILVDNYTKIKENQSKEVSDKIFSQLKNDLLKQSMQNMQENYVNSLNVKNPILPINNVNNVNNVNNSNNYTTSNLVKETNRLTINQDFNINAANQKNELINYNQSVVLSNNNEKLENITKNNKFIEEKKENNFVKPIFYEQNTNSLPTPLIINDDSDTNEIKLAQDNNEKSKKSSVNDIAFNNNLKDVTPRENERLDTYNNDFSVSSNGLNFDTNRIEPVELNKKSDLKVEKEIKPIEIIEIKKENKVIAPISTIIKDIPENKKEIIAAKEIFKKIPERIEKPKEIIKENIYNSKDNINTSNLHSSKIKKPINSILEEDESRNISNLM